LNINNYEEANMEVAIDPSIFLGLTKKRSQDLSEAKNLVYRLVRIDDEEFLGYPKDMRDDRVCVVIENGVVVEATIQ
jgi:hypothetical protein